jgi:peptidoglycan/xylan/chitin deacetylase (PgdA/CDA1 family)
MKRRIKSLLGRVAYGTRMYERLWQNRATIIFFHRIDDRYPTDPNTVGVDAFRAYCDFFQKYFVVVSLTELLARIARGADISRNVVITFDDGYVDNFRVAAPELQRRGLPACFFVTTGFIDDRRDAWWDEQRSIRSEWMTWDDVRALAAHGFEIGGHTATHADLGTVRGADAEREIVWAKARLEEQIGRKVHHFCFPFGGDDNITPENRELVKAAGYDCCLATGGSTIAPNEDVFRVRRIGASPWFRTPYQFGYEVMMAGAAVRPTASGPRATTGRDAMLVTRRS